MPTNEPIRQPIEVDYKGKDAQAAARDMKAVGDAAEKSGDQAAKSAPKLQTREQQLASQRARLEQLLRSEDRYEQALNQGRRVSDRATASIRRHTVAAGESAASSSIFASATRSITGSVTGAATGLLGAGGLIAALRILGDELQERTRQTREFLDANLDLQFLSKTFNDQERDFVASASIFAGRDPSETARAFAQLKSRFPSLGDQELQTLFLEIAESARTTEADLRPLSEGISGLFQATGDAQVAQNIFRETVIQAGQSDPAVVSALLGKFLGPGTTLLGLTAGEASGGVAGVTGLTTQRPEEQVQGLLTFLLNIKGKGTPEINEVLDEAGIDKRSGDAFEVAGQVLNAVDQGRISPDQFETLTGREGIKIGSALLDPSRRAAFFQKVQAVAEAELDPSDRTADALVAQFQNDPMQSLNSTLKRVEAASKVADSHDQRALEVQLVQDLVDLKLKEAGVNAVSRRLDRAAGSVAASVGASPETVVGASLGGGKFASPIRDEVLEELDAARSGTTVIQHINQGTVINNGRDPFTSDIDEGRPRR